jgi:hypothetical protein
VRTLESAPPSPLVHGLPAAEEELDEPAPPAAPAPRRVGPRLLPLLASAAAVVLLFLGVRSLMTPSTLHFPETPLLRGSAGGPVYFPRDRVLLPSADIAALFPALASPVRIEVEGQAEADSYRFEIQRLEGKAFGTTTRYELVVGAAPIDVAKKPKELGRYTLEAWVVRRGLDQKLGAHDFQIVADAAVESRLRALFDRAEPGRTLDAVLVLHEAGFVTDARELARALPQSAERDLYLGQIPGR